MLQVTYPAHTTLWGTPAPPGPHRSISRPRSLFLGGTAGQEMLSGPWGRPYLP